MLVGSVACIEPSIEFMVVDWRHRIWGFRHEHVIGVSKFREGRSRICGFVYILANPLNLNNCQLVCVLLVVDVYLSEFTVMEHVVAEKAVKEAS